MDQPMNVPANPINKKTGPVPIFILVLFVLLVVAGLSYVLLSGKWVIPGDNAAEQNTNTPAAANAADNTNQLLGGDRDEYGCIPSAGYSWCEPKQKCVRAWEEPCTTEALNGVPNP